MTLMQQLTEDMKAALKAHDSERLQTVRFIIAEVKNAQIDGAGSDDASVQKVIASLVKKSNDAVSEFAAAGRDDLATSEKGKIAVMQKYLPAQLSDEKLRAMVQEVIDGAGKGAKPGQLIGQVMKKVAGQADGARVKQLVTEIIN